MSLIEGLTPCCNVCRFYDVEYMCFNEALSYFYHLENLVIIPQLIRFIGAESLDFEVFYDLVVYHEMRPNKLY